MWRLLQKDKKETEKSANMTLRTTSSSSLWFSVCFVIYGLKCDKRRPLAYCLLDFKVSIFMSVRTAACLFFFLNHI